MQAVTCDHKNHKREKPNKSKSTRQKRSMTCSILSLREKKLFLLKALKVPDIEAESGMTLNAVPPCIMATETTCSVFNII